MIEGYKVKESESKKYLSTEEMSENCRVLIGLPCYGGMMTTETVRGLMAAQGRAVQKNIMMECCFVTNESLIPRARNRIVAHFLASKQNYTHLMFIDVDSDFQGDDIFKLLHYNKDVIGAPVSVKTLPERHVVEVKGAEKGKMNCTADKKLVELSNIGSAFYLIKRRVFEEMKNAYPELHTDPRVPIKEIQTEQATFLEGRDWAERFLSEFYSFYDTGLGDSLNLSMIDGENKKNVYMSEDYVFAQRWRDIGGRIWMDPRIRVGHIGRYNYSAPAIQNFPKEFWLKEDYIEMSRYEGIQKSRES